MKVDLSIISKRPEITLTGDTMVLARLMNCIDPSRMVTPPCRKEMEDLKRGIHAALEKEGFYEPIKEDVSSMSIYLLNDIDSCAFSQSKFHLTIILPNKEITALKTGKRYDILVNEDLKLSFEPETIWELKRALEQYV